jgi:hypothetical protein
LEGFRSGLEQYREIAGEWAAVRAEFRDMRSALASFFAPNCRFEFPVSFKLNGVFSHLITSQASPFDRFVIVSQSSGDVWRLIDPNSQDNYSSASGEWEWIQFDFPEPISIVGLKLKSAFRSFLKTWSFASIDRDGVRTELFSTVDDERLNGSSNEVVVDLKSTVSSTFRLEKYGMNWQGTRFFRLKNIELFSDQPEYLGGVFRTLVEKAGECHHARVLVSASNFDFQHFHILGARKSMCTLLDEGPPWIQFEITRGSVIVNGYRLEFVTDNIFGAWSLQASNDLDAWSVIDRRSGPPGTQRLEVCHCRSEIAFRYFRVYYEARDTQGTPKLRLRHFEIFGIYLDSSA